MQKQKLCIPCVGLPSFAVVPGGTTGSISSVGAYYTLIDYNGTSGYVYNSYLEVY